MHAPSGVMASILVLKVTKTNWHLGSNILYSFKFAIEINFFVMSFLIYIDLLVYLFYSCLYSN